MRIACVHVPQFALQCVTRIDPSLRGAAVAVVGAGVDPVAGTVARVALHSPVVLACSRAAWALGVRIGMTATAARSLVAHTFDATLHGSVTMTAPVVAHDAAALALVSADAAVERDTMRAIADALLGVSSTVELGGRVGPAGAHYAIYCEVPAKTRGTTFGERILERLSALGVTARIGIADDRFTAWVAASHAPLGAARTSDLQAERAGKMHRRSAAGLLHGPIGTTGARSESAPTAEDRSDDAAVVSVPRGGSAAFLAPRPLSLLSIPVEVLHMLESLGITTLGEFAALPPPSIHLTPGGFRARPIEADFQALARGESGATLRPYTPDAAVSEQAVITETVSAPAAIAMLAERLALRLQGRVRAATRLELQIAIAGETKPRSLGSSALHDGKLLETAEDLADAIAKALAAAPDDSMRLATRLRVIVVGEAIPGEATSAETTMSLHALDGAAAAIHAAGAALQTLGAAAVRGIREVDAGPSAASIWTGAPSSATRFAPSRLEPQLARPSLSAQATLSSRMDPQQQTPDDTEIAEVEAAVQSAAAELSNVIDPLGVVLSSTGTGAWHLTSPSLRDERRDAHRRTQRGKERRHRARAQMALVQPRLFKTLV